MRTRMHPENAAFHGQSCTKPVTPLAAAHQLQSSNQNQSHISNSESSADTTSGGCTKRRRGGRGPTIMRDVWEQPQQKRTPVSFNSSGQPNDTNTTSALANFLGTVARNGNHAPLQFTRWAKMPESYKEDMLKIVKLKFDIPEGVDDFIVKSLSDKWRTWKSLLRKSHFDPTKSVEDHLSKVPARVEKDQWKELVLYWFSQEGMDASVRNKLNRRKRLNSSHPRTGTRSFAVAKEIEREKLGREPSRDDLFKTYYAKSNTTLPTNKVSVEAIVASSEKEKQYWTKEHIEIFCRLCIDQIHHPGMHFDEELWRNIAEMLKECTDENYTSAQLKSKWNNLKEVWKKWKQLIDGETNLRWDPQKYTVDASEEWWRQKIQMNPEFRSFRTKGIPPSLETLLDSMFMNTETRSQDSPSSFKDDFSGDSSDDDDDGMHSTDVNIDKIIADLSSKSKAVAHEPIDSSNTLMNKEICQNSAELSLKKTKNTMTTMNTVSKIKEKKKKSNEVSNLKKQLDKIYSAMEKSQIAVNTSGEEPPSMEASYGDFVEMLEKIPEVEQNDKFHFFALDHLKEKMNEVIFKSFKSDEKRVNWLKHEFKKHKLR